MKLSERMQEILDDGFSNSAVETVHVWADKVAQLERKVALQERIIRRGLEHQAQLEADNEAWFELCRFFVGGGDKHILKMRDAYLPTKESK